MTSISFSSFITFSLNIGPTPTAYKYSTISSIFLKDPSSGLMSLSSCFVYLLTFRKKKLLEIWRFFYSLILCSLFNPLWAGFSPTTMWKPLLSRVTSKPRPAQSELALYYNLYFVLLPSFSGPSCAPDMLLGAVLTKNLFSINPGSINYFPFNVLLILERCKLSNRLLLKNKKK